jgi:predicted nucleic acid-binding protein
MNAPRLSLDANLLFYAVDRDAGPKRERASEIIRRSALELECVLTAQALAEFYVAVTRKEKMPPAEAAAQVEDWRILFGAAPTTGTSLKRAITAAREHSISFWDAMLWAAAREAGATLLLSEDLQDGRELDGVRFSNPFAEGWSFETALR